MRAGGPRVASGDMTLAGVYYAIVTQNQDPEKKARVKIRLPWLDQGDQDQTQWAVISAPFAGDKYGWYTLPDNGDVVAVMFIAGEITRPVILGGVWSKTDAPPEKNEGNNDFRGYVGRSGGKMLMDDSSNGKVAILDKAAKIGLVVGSFQQGGSGGNAVAAPLAPAINSAAQMGVDIFSMEGDMEITAKGKITVNAQNIEITSKSNADINATGNATLEGGAGNCNGGGATKLEGSSTAIN